MNSTVDLWNSVLHSAYVNLVHELV